MKVALVLSSFPQSSETFIVSKIIGLVESGIQVDVICRHFDSEAWRGFSRLWSIPRSRMRVRVAWPLRPAWLLPLLGPLSLVRVILANPAGARRYLTGGWRRFGFKVFRRLYVDADFLIARPDVTHFEFGTLAARRMYLRDLIGCRVVVSFRGFDLNFAEADSPNYYQEVWKSADAVHCLGDHLWSRAQRRGCPGSKRKVLIPPAVDDRFFRPVERLQPAELGTKERPLRILSVARVEWKKGHEYALEAVRLLRQRGLTVRFRIVGAGEHLEAVSFCRRQLGLEDSVALLGALSPARVLRQMAWADVFVHGAVSEAFCNAVIEAQATGLPVVTSDAGGLAENVEDGVTGFVVARRNPQAMAEKLMLLARDPELRRAMSAAGPARVARKFRLEQQIAAFLNLYRQTCGLESLDVVPG